MGFWSEMKIIYPVICHLSARVFGWLRRVYMQDFNCGSVLLRIEGRREETEPVRRVLSSSSFNWIGFVFTHNASDNKT